MKRIAKLKGSQIKVLFIAIGGLIVIALIVSAVQDVLRDREQKQVEEQKVVVQEDLQKEDSCNDANLAELARLYESEFTSQEEKALYAEQAGSCYSVNTNYDLSLEWYNKAKSIHEATGNTEAAEVVSLSIDTVQILKNEQQKIDNQAETSQEEDRGEG